jgi:mRNA interferase MazF
MLDGPPQRWHVYVVDLEPRVGTKPGKQRPCVAIQPTEFGAVGHPSTVVVPLTTRIVGEDAFPLRVRIPAGVCSLPQDSDALIDQLLAWDNTLFRKDLGVLPEGIQQLIREALADFLDLG